MNNPVLSIITVNYNNRAGLLQTLESIRSQSFDSYEHIIIDAGSTDGSKEIIQSYEKESSHLSYWISEPDKGIYDGMNKGIRQAHGEYLCFLNSGDCLCPDILNKVTFDGTDYLYGDVLMCYERKNKKRTYPDTLDLIYLSARSLHHQSCFIHRSLFQDKAYDTNYKIISDWAHSFQCIVMENCTYRHLPFVVSQCDGRGISSNGKALDKERIQWFQATYPAVLSQSFIDCNALEQAGFREVVHILGQTHKFKKRMKALILFLYRIHRLFSFKHSS